MYGRCRNRTKAKQARTGFPFSLVLLIVNVLTVVFSAAIAYVVYLLGYIVVSIYVAFAILLGVAVFCGENSGTLLEDIKLLKIFKIIKL